MTNCWKVNPKDRPTFPEILRDLREMLADNEIPYINLQQVEDENFQTQIEPGGATMKNADTTKETAV
ncbi:Hypothetical predicted protein [Paramuricea clavata]|uniref:Uncharacterized protein n=1 Tax=Paramuricea clavata TaxID=317549 RepID=A0A6S7K251_PARCT|nr:Hypothetical predicted protein [Paramuricea clavata]